MIVWEELIITTTLVLGMYRERCDYMSSSTKRVAGRRAETEYIKESKGRKDDNKGKIGERTPCTGVDIVRCLCRGDILTIDNTALANIKKYYAKGAKNVRIFEPPELGTDILLLEHCVSDRLVTANTNFCMEAGFNRKCVVYHVEEIVVKGESYYNPNNVVVLSYSVLHGPRCFRRVEFRDFYCGFYYPRVLTDDEKRVVEQHREKVNEEFSIRRI